MSTQPFRENEHQIMLAVLRGDSKELDALRSQLESIRYESPLYKMKLFLGFSYKSSRLKRSRQSLKFKIGWGCGAQDWQLGDRRLISLDDMFIETQDGDYVQTKLEINNGLLQKLQLVDVIDPKTLTRHRYYGSLRDISPVRFLYLENDGQYRFLAQRSTGGPSLLRLPTSFPNPTDLHKWLLSIDDSVIELPPYVREEMGLKLPLHFRRACPADQEELEVLERKCLDKCALTFPNELKNFWKLTNGASFFGQLIFGTYDTYLFKSSGSWRLLFMRNMFLDNHYLSVELADPHYGACGKARIHEEFLHIEESGRTWDSLQECLMEFIEDIKTGKSASDYLGSKTIS